MSICFMSVKIWNSNTQTDNGRVVYDLMTALGSLKSSLKKGGGKNEYKLKINQNFKWYRTTTNTVSILIQKTYNIIYI